MENEYLYEVYYQNVLVKTIIAHTKWEAIDKVYNRLIPEYPNLVRSLFRVKLKR